MDRRNFLAGAALAAGSASVTAQTVRSRERAGGSRAPQPASFGQAGRDFPKVGGNLANTNYSSLRRIHRDNVRSLGGAWHINLEGGDTSQGQQSTIVAQEGVLYVQTSQQNVFAIDGRTGAVRWKVNVGKTPTNMRGVAVGEGMVFSTSGDDFVYALDRATGRTVWRTQLLTEAEEGRALVRERDGDALFQGLKGAALAGAIVYWDGLIYVGMQGSTNGARGRAYALDAKTGRLAWRFWGAPGPGEFGNDTWEGESWNLRGELDGRPCGSIRAEAHRLPTVHHHRMSDGECALGRAQPQHRGGDLLGLAQASDRLLGHHALVAVSSARCDALDHLGIDDARADGIHADVGLRIVERRTLRETDDPELRGHIRRLAGDSDHATARRGVDDGATALAKHDRHHVLHAQEHAAQVDGHEAIPVLFRHIRDRTVRLLDAGIVEGHVDAAIRADALFHGGLHVRALAHVASHGDGRTSHFLDQADGFLRAFPVKVRHDDLGAFPGKGESGRPPDAGPGTRDEGDCAGESLVRVWGHEMLLVEGCTISALRS
jgi:hypothetical protein